MLAGHAVKPTPYYKKDWFPAVLDVIKKLTLNNVSGFRMHFD
jgi:hypothetical protein